MNYTLGCCWLVMERAVGRSTFVQILSHPSHFPFFRRCIDGSSLLRQQLATEEIGISKDAYQILKYHGSYQQSNREIKGKVKDYQFMLRLKQPAGELPPDLYRLLDDLSVTH